jgi:hypothetical protein
MPSRHALIIGIDRYSKFEEQYQLAGCVNDARLIKSVLIDHFDFGPSDIIELHDEAASQQGILMAMDRLVDAAGRDDIVVFHFSGHGSRRKSVNVNEGTGMDSTIIPSDSGCVDPYPNLEIIDDQIRDWIERLAQKTRNITLIFDCCHSGTITRDISGAKVRGVPPDPRSLEAMGVDPASLPAPAKTGTRSAGTASWMALNDSHVVISGCRDDEYSHEYSFEQGDDLVRGGALTHFLTRAVLQAKSGATWRDVFEIARQGVNTRFPQQHPQIEGAQDRELFGVRDITPLRYIPIVSAAGNVITLGGGAAHGLLVGSLWTAYSPGTKEIQNGGALANLEITRVGNLSAEAKVRDGSVSLPVGARCVEAAPAASRFLLQVDLSALETSDAALWRDCLSQSKLLKIAKSHEAADLRIRRLSPGQQPDLEPVDSPSWAVVDRGGQLAMPCRRVDDAAAMETVSSNLESIARFRNALALDNPASQLDVEFNIYRVHPDDELELANGGGFEFEEGERLAFEIINRENRNVFVSILDFGLTGRISLIYPPARAAEMISAGQTLKIGVGQQRMTLGVPREMQASVGTETLKAFISTEETDFRWLQQGGMRSIGKDCGGLRQQFEAAYNGPATREIVLESSDEGDWKAPARAFQVRRRTH